MERRAFAEVEHWVFDLDNTLYPPSARLFEQIEARLNAWIVRTFGMTRDEADALRMRYWELYGTTLSGLVAEHDIDPAAVIAEIHDISFESLRPDRELDTVIRRLPGRRVVYTNASATYASRVLEARGLGDAFHSVYGVEHAEFRSKPESVAFDTVFAKAGIDPTRGAMFDDDPRNLEVPFALGMRTIHVADSPVPATHIHHHTSDLFRFLSLIETPGIAAGKN